MNHVNETIFPELGIQPKWPISLHTARHWPVQLGWVFFQVKKGVYVDGHEQEDMVLYCNNVFLPAMAKFRRW